MMPAVEGIGMIAPLVIERVPETPAHMLARRPPQSVVARILIVRAGISFGLDEHRHLAPPAVHAARRIVRVPVIDVVPPLAGEIAHLRIQLPGIERPVAPVERMGELHGKVFGSAGRGIATRITVRIGILLMQDSHDIRGEILRIPCLVENRAPKATPRGGCGRGAPCCGCRNRPARQRPDRRSRTASPGY